VTRAAPAWRAAAHLLPRFAPLRGTRCTRAVRRVSNQSLKLLFPGVPAPGGSANGGAAAASS